MSEILKGKVNKERSPCEVQRLLSMKEAIVLPRRRILISINERRRVRALFPFLPATFMEDEKSLRHFEPSFINKSTFKHMISVTYNLFA